MNHYPWRPYSNKEIKVRITAALDRVYAKPVDVEASFARLQRRIVTLPQPTDEKFLPRHARQPNARRLSPVPGIAGARGVTVIAFALCLAAALGYMTIHTQTDHPVEAHPTTDTGAFLSHPVIRTETTQSAVISLGSLRPKTAATSTQPRVKSAILHGHRVMTWVATIEERPRYLATATFTFSLETTRVRKFSAILPASDSGLTSSCRWTVQFTDEPPVTYQNRTRSDVPLTLHAANPAKMTIKVRALRSTTSPANCAMANPELQSAPANPSARTTSSATPPTPNPVTSPPITPSTTPSSTPSSTPTTTTSPTGILSPTTQ